MSDADDEAMVGRVAKRLCEVLRAERDSGYVRGFVDGITSDWRPMDAAPQTDGEEVLALVKWDWEPAQRRRIVRWNNGIGKTAYTWPCWMCAVTTTEIPARFIYGWLPLPPLPASASEPATNGSGTPSEA